jgi:CheY-like chemotaxis protein
MMSFSADKFNVFVVDDDLHVLESLRFLLETTGFNVRTFRSGAALLDQVASKQADCFVIDYKMANMNGIDLTTRLGCMNGTLSHRSYSLPGILTRISHQKPQPLAFETSFSSHIWKTASLRESWRSSGRRHNVCPACVARNLRLTSEVTWGEDPR